MLLSSTGSREVLSNYSTLSDGEKDMTKDMTQYWDTLQSAFDCCGFDRVQDWEQSHFFNETGKYPPSCCGKGDFETLFDDNNVIAGSCNITEVENFTKDNSCTDRARGNIKILGGVALGVLFVEFLSMLASGEVIAAGTEKLGSVPSGGGAAAAAAPAAGGAAPAAAAAAAPPPKEESEEEDDDMGFGLFD